MLQLMVDITKQLLFAQSDTHLIRTYSISTAKKGVGEQWGSEQTPRGKHIIRAKIGEHCAINTIFVKRRPTGEIFTSAMRIRYPERDWILTRILWLSGLEKGKNRLGLCDTMRRYIYIHGSPDDIAMGIPGSRGCIRMRNQDIIELFHYTPVGTVITIG